MAKEKCKALVITLKGDPKTVLADVKKSAAKNDVIIAGDEKSGKMKHKKIGITGVYKVKGQKVAIEMTDDTWLADCTKINKTVVEWFKGK